MVGTVKSPERSLAARISNRVRELSLERDLRLDLTLSGRARRAGLGAGEVLEQVVDLLVDSARLSADIHHMSLDLRYLPDGLHLRLEHDAALNSEARERVEDGALAAFEAVGALGGSLSLSAGRGF